MMDEFDFTEEEIREQLEKLGYTNVPQQRLQEFKRDLEQLVRAERSGSSSWSTLIDGSSAESEVVRDTPVRGSPLQENGRGPPGAGVNGHNGLNHIQYAEKYFNEDAVRQGKSFPKSVCTIHIPTVSHDPQTPNRSEAGEQSMYSETDLTPDTRPKVISDGNMSVQSVSSTDSKLIKRRVMRKRDGQKQVTDELTESEMGDMSSLEERLHQLEMPHDLYRRGVYSRRRASLDSDPNYPPRPRSAASSVPSFRLPDDYTGLKALIKPMHVEPNKRNVKKCDPVAQFQKYNQAWSSQRAPGEKSHSQLRWGVREQMLYQDEVVDRKPSKIYVPNNYKIPSDKKRKNLRWQIRQDMAAGIVPPSIFD